MDLNNPYILAAIVLWTLPWKLMGLWRAATQKQKIWFGLIFFINTFGLLEIVYYFYLYNHTPNLTKYLPDFLKNLKKKSS